MTLSADQRNSLVIMYEGYALQPAGNHGKAHAIEIARCSIDGNVNALLRMDDPKAVAEYVFALSDRVCGRLRTPTELPALAPPVPQPSVAADPPARKPMRYWTIWSIGWLCGFVMGVASFGRKLA